MMQHTLPDNDAWIARFKAFRSWVEEHGSLPENDPEGGREDTLRTWLERQRTAVLDGSLAENLETILRSVPGALPRRRLLSVPPVKPGSRLSLLENFCRTHGRLPAYSGSEPGERDCYKYINDYVRVKYRRNELSPEDLERLEKIPGVFKARTLSRANAGAAEIASDPRTAALLAFCEEEKRVPSCNGPASESRLYAYVRRTIRPAFAGGRLDETVVRHLESVPGVLSAVGRAGAAAA